MARLRSRKDVDAIYQQAKLLSSQHILPFGAQVAMRTRLGGIRSGYINRLTRLQKKTKGQLKGIPGCGPTVRDWGIDLDR